MARICPICHGLAFDNPFACMLNSDHNFMADETIEGKNEREKETKKFISEWRIKVKNK